jgi:methylmalonyl-CoA mutase
MSDTSLAADFPPATEEAWLALVDKVLKGGSFDRLSSTTADGIRIAPLYTRGAHGSRDEAGFPGSDPYVRGAQAAPRPHGLWDVRSAVDAGDAVEANRRALQDLERGVTSLSVRWAPGADAAWLSRALEGVHLDLAPVVLDAGPDVLAAVDALTQLWNERGLEPTGVSGGYGADPVAVLATRGGDADALAHGLSVLGRLAAMSAERAPGVRAVTVDATAVAEAGGSEGQELAAMLSTGAAYLRALADAGLDVDTACRQVEVVLSADAEVFTTIAKLRAARRLWAAMAEACGASEPARAMALHVRTARRMLTVRDPWVNLLRVTAATFAAGVAGADGITAHGYDALLAATPAGGGGDRDLGRRMARNTQLLLQEESNLGRVLDPAGGSWFVESLTDELAGVAWERFQDLERRGGVAAALLDGSLAADVATVRDERFARVATRTAAVTGVSEFPNLAEQLEAAPADDHVTDGALLPPVRWAEPFEALRDDADRRRAEGAPAQVFLVNLGPVADHTARTSFAKNLFEAGGIEAITSHRGNTAGFSSVEEAVEDWRTAGIPIACLCSSDARYGSDAAAYAMALRQAGVARLYLAGRPSKELAEQLATAGVDEFVGLGTDVLDVLRRALDVTAGPDQPGPGQPGPGQQGADAR